MSKIPFKKIFPRPQFFVLLLVLIIGVQVLCGQGLLAGLMLGCRLAALAVLMPLLVITTGAGRLALGLTRLGLNYRAAYIITSTINLVPVFEAETRHIMEARRLRGMKSVSFKEYPAIALPLMIKVMRQAQQTSLAMDARAFGAYKSRTWLNEIKMGASDFGAYAAGIAWAFAVIAANILLNG